MQRNVIDGVPVYWSEQPGPLEAALVFGCGVRDETFRTLGVTHLVEHLAMSTLPRLHHEHNASVDLEVTDFTCTGRPEQVTAFLERVCLALADLPTDRLAQEAGVLAAEGSAAAHPTVGALLSHRYGIQGPGLAPYVGPGPDRIPLDALHEHVRRFFHAGNAALVLSGPPPAGLRLPLPGGVRPERSAFRALPVATPSWRQDEAPSVGLSVHVGLGDQAAQLALAVLAERLRRAARHDQGLSYEVSIDAVLTGVDVGDRVIHLDAREGEEARVAELLWTEARRLAADGPTPAELLEELTALRELFADPRAELGAVGGRATAELLDYTFRGGAEVLATVEELTVGQIAAAFGRALRTALLVVPRDTELDLAQAGLPAHRCDQSLPLPRGVRALRPSRLDRLLNRRARVMRLWGGEGGLLLRDPDGELHAVDYRDVVGVEERGAGRVVYGVQGCVIGVLPEYFPGLAPVARAVDAAVPAVLRYPSSAFHSAD
ncbi:insulinase family protein [Kitasatospora sp. NBC_01287]|uniref:hypothetical protein n=1 Tax=Kitasatospora sp. NBC_01287 TaxID=2903573 RepID=UPI0022596D97|nr:hypothetical protein [Kitasatospora sp. NBC_01287]MCX4749071.1 insulinase family protein [Kitasatospora sp. NBC_01287]